MQQATASIESAPQKASISCRHAARRPHLQHHRRQHSRLRDRAHADVGARGLRQRRVGARRRDQTGRKQLQQQRHCRARRDGDAQRAGQRALRRVALAVAQVLAYEAAVGGCVVLGVVVSLLLGRRVVVLDGLSRAELS